MDSDVVLQLLFFGRFHLNRFYLPLPVLFHYSQNLEKDYTLITRP